VITVPIYEPLWRCQHGQIDQYGEGLLARNAWENESNINSFSVKTAGGELTVLPSKGEIIFDGSTKIKTDAGKLIWMREMAVQINTHDTNNRSAPSVLFYSIGIENTKGKHGFRIYDGQRIVNGI